MWKTFDQMWKKNDNMSEIHLIASISHNYDKMFDSYNSSEMIIYTKDSFQISTESKRINTFFLVKNWTVFIALTYLVSVMVASFKWTEVQFMFEMQVDIGKTFSNYKLQKNLFGCTKATR